MNTHADHPDRVSGTGTGTGRDGAAGNGTRDAGQADTEQPSGDAVTGRHPTGDVAGAAGDDSTVDVGPAVDAPSDDPADGPAGESALDAARRERDEYLDMVRRVQADFENYKKRMLRQQTDQLERAAENLVAKLLPALDALDLARVHLGEGAAASPDTRSLLQASALLVDTLTKEGLDRIDDDGVPFDPTTHDAVEHAAAGDAGAGDDDDGSGAGEVASPAGPVVAEVLRPGYRWKGRVIRPAMVRVLG
jgi:molecular chaperone GrpE